MTQKNNNISRLAFIDSKKSARGSEGQDSEDDANLFL